MVKEPLPVIITEEMVKGRKYFIAWCPTVDIVSQGRTYDEARDNIKEALELYFKDPDAKNVPMRVTNASLSSVLVSIPEGVLKNVRKTTNTLW